MAGCFLFYGWIIFHCVLYICHIFFIHSSTGVHLGCFHVLAIVNNVQWTCRCRSLFEMIISSSLDIYPKVGLLGHMVVLFLSFWGISILFSMVAALFTFVSTVPKGSLCSTSSPTLGITCLFHGSHSNRCGVMISHCDFVFPWWLVILNPFSCKCWPFVNL